MLRAVVFDLFNTLIDPLSEGRERQLRLMAGDLGIDPDAFVEYFHAAYPQRIIGSPATLADQCRDIATAVGGRPTVVQIEAAVQRRLAFNRGMFTIPTSTWSVLRRLRSDGFALGLVSNLTADSVTVLRETALPDALDALALSCELGIAKPDPQIYLAITETLRIEPSECLFVGDGADSELRGAESVGMRAIRICEWADSDPTWDGPTIVSLQDVFDVI